MSKDSGPDAGYGDEERIKAWLDGWGRYFWAGLAVALAGFIAWNVFTGLFG